MQRTFGIQRGKPLAEDFTVDPADVKETAQRIRDRKRERREHRLELKAKAKAKAERHATDAAEWEGRENGWEFSQWPKKIFTCVFCAATSDRAKMVRQGGIALCLDCARVSVKMLESNAPV